MNALVKATTHELWSYEEAEKRSKVICMTELCPKAYKNKPADAMIAIMSGQEIGLSPMQALSAIAIINGRASLWGDAMLALCLSSGLLEDIDETIEGNVATCTVLRKGMKTAKKRTFSIDDAKNAGLWNKSGPWTLYPKRMLQLRARAFALRDLFPDVLGGIPCAEEMRDVEQVVQEATPIVAQDTSTKSASQRLNAILGSDEDYLMECLELAEHKKTRQELLDLYAEAKKNGLAEQSLSTLAELSKKIITEKSLL